MKKLHLPCLRGRLGTWTYYSTIMKVKDIVNNHRIITVPESEELYSKNINQVLQREIDKNRINKISKYLNNSEDHFFSSIIVAIHKGNPEWSDIDIEDKFSIKNENLDNESLNFIENKFGILSLSGQEEIFALDGQHRLVGLREAITTNPEIGEEEISLVYVIHNHKNIERTRRLFTVLNRYAEKPKQAELIILEEDDVAAINTRKLVSDHKVLSLKNAISDSKAGGIAVNDFKSFTTLVNIYNINKILYAKTGAFYTTRPSDQEIENYYKISKDFWDFFFKSFPYLVKYINGDRNIKINNSIIDRNIESGGSLLLRPVGQEILAKTYKHFLNLRKIKTLEENITKIDFNLSGDNFKYLFWNNSKIVGKELRLKQNLILYLLNECNGKKVHPEMTKIYKSYNLKYIDLLPVFKPK
jgi:DNA sulfur modification protein DndB